MWPKTTRHMFSNKNWLHFIWCWPILGWLPRCLLILFPSVCWSYSPPLFSTMGLPKSKKTEAQLFPWSFICLFYIGNGNKSNKQSFPMAQISSSSSNHLQAEALSYPSKIASSKRKQYVSLSHLSPCWSKKPLPRRQWTGTRVTQVPPRHLAKNQGCLRKWLCCNHKKFNESLRVDWV
jgi:hypothetical protein